MKYELEHDAEGRLIAVTYANNPDHAKSWRREYDAQGNAIAVIRANNPNDLRSWREEPQE